jgi:hypothetical protein
MYVCRVRVLALVCICIYMYPCVSLTVPAVSQGVFSSVFKSESTACISYLMWIESHVVMALCTVVRCTVHSLFWTGDCDEASGGMSCGVATGV